MRRVLLAAAAASLAAAALLAVPFAQAGGALRVLATTTDLADIARAVGGDAVVVDCVTKGPEDPHFISAKPSLIRAAAAADALLVVGMDLEIGYEPLLREESRNGKIQKGKPGYVDASAGVRALEIPEGPIDRSMGDVHAYGNPHYLCDPVRAKQAAATVADALATIDPDRADAYRDRLASFQRTIDVAMWGEALLEKQPASRLENRLQRGELVSFLRARGLEELLGGWAAELAPYSGRKVVSYHGLWIYLLDRFHLVEAAKVEPKPGIDPTPRHIVSVVRTMKDERARVLLYGTYHPERTALQVAEQGGARAVRLAHMPRAFGGDQTYVDMVGANVKALVAALRETAE
jgi:zinc/manganese transport system substrate-binding protein